MKYVVFSGLIFLLLGCSTPAPESERQLATRVLAEYVRKANAPKSVVVLSNPFTKEPGRSPQADAFEQAGVEGLREGFGGRVRIAIEFPELKADVLRDPNSVKVDPQSTTPLSFLIKAEAFSEAVEKHPGAEVIVSLIGLPVNLTGFKQWQAAGKPAFALLLPDWRMIGDRKAILESFRSGKLAAAIVRKPNAPETEVSGNSREEFDRRYFLMTKENAAGIMDENPGLFGIR